MQGVSFRFFTQRKAAELGVCGFVRNEPDGSVYIEAEGSPEVLDQFLRWCRRGPSLARVEKVKSGYSNEVKGFRDFVIRY